MAYGHDWLIQSASFLWIFTLLLSESQSKKTQILYMESSECGNWKTVGGAVVYSHARANGEFYPHDVDCQITFKAQQQDWKLMMRILELDIPDQTENGYCNDALYVYDDSTSKARGMESAGGTGGLCGNTVPDTIKSTGQYLTVAFKTDSDGVPGHGFKFTITAFSDDHKKLGTCGSSFMCDNHLCIDQELTCDGLDSCGDHSDEAPSGRAKCKEECGVICQFLSLGVTASIFISVGSIVVIITCIVVFICCCRRSFCRKAQDASTCSANAVGASTTSTTNVANGNNHNGRGHVFAGPVQGSMSAGMADVSYQVSPPSSCSRTVSTFSNYGYGHQGYIAMQAVLPPPDPHHPHHPHPGQPVSSVYSYSKDSYVAPISSAHSSSQPSHHRSHTPTSSKSGKSNRSNNSTSVTYSQGTDKIALPVNL